MSLVKNCERPCLPTKTVTGDVPMRLPITMEAPSLQYAARLPGKLFVLGSTKPAAADGMMGWTHSEHLMDHVMISKRTIRATVQASSIAIPFLWYLRSDQRKN